MGNCITIKDDNNNETRYVSSRDSRCSNIVNIKSKKAVLIGLNYAGTSVALKGCINDANTMKYTLKDFGYTDVKVLTDNNITKEHNILEILDDLIESKTDIMYFQYSGHGVQKYDMDGDEKDNLDEALYSVNGTIITDDQINKSIEKVSSKSVLIMVIDACHSGTIVDLPYQLIGDNIIKVNDKIVEANVICISGCRDDQVSMDVKDGNICYGAM